MKVPSNDPARLEALRSYGILDTDFEPTFDRITRLAANLFGAPSRSCPSWIRTGNGSSPWSAWGFAKRLEMLRFVRTQF